VRASIERFGTTAYGCGDVVHVPVVRAGNWVFGTGLRASLANGLIDPAVLKPGRPLDAPPKAQREAQKILERMAAQLAEAGSSMSRVARLDQYYPDPSAVDPYHVARKQALAGQVAPSTSIIVSRLLNLDAAMDVQVVAATSASGYAVQRIKAGLEAPETSGYAPCVRVGDMIFIAGQLARDASGNIAVEAKPPAGQLWSGTRIGFETGYLVARRLIPALEAAGSGLDLVLKAQVYLSHVEDFPAFWQQWTQAFGRRVPPTTVVPVRHPAFGTSEATIEVNLIAVHESARSRLHDVQCEVELIGSGMLPACIFDGLVFVAGLMGIDESGLAESARVRASAPFFHDSARAQMADILAKAKKILAAAGTDLANVVRALHFHSDLADFHASCMEWRSELGALGVPFSAVEVAPQTFVPGAGLIVDLWGYTPKP
jgi:enamine deaminase RidA (YjgF/YER057c/UK114 family)